MGYCRQAEFLSVAIKAVIQRALHERVSVIVEGVHVHPSLIKNIIDPGEALVVPIMLAVLKRKQLQSRIKGRGTDVPQRRAERYLEHFESIWKLQTFLLSEADQANVPIISNIEREDVFREIMLYTIGRLGSKFDKTPEQVFD